jgi:hypothetical protein
MLFLPRASRSDCLVRAEARGYRDHANKDLPELALLKLQPLSLRAALAEATFLESELSA